MSRKVIAACGGDVRSKTIAVLGLTFKPNTDDMRDAPPIDTIQGLADRGASVVACHLQGVKAAKELIPGIAYGADAYDAYDAANGADAIVVVTEWSEFRSLGPPRLRQAIKSHVVIDQCNVDRRDEVVRHGFK